MSGVLAPGGLELALGGGQVASLFLVLMRTTGLVVTAPILGHRAVPAPVKAGLAAVLALTLARGATVAPGALPVLIAAPIELLIGLCLGLIISLGFQAVELGGRLISLQMGLSLGAVFSPTTHEGRHAVRPVLLGLRRPPVPGPRPPPRDRPGARLVVRDAADRRRLADRPVAAGRAHAGARPGARDADRDADRARPAADRARRRAPRRARSPRSTCSSSACRSRSWSALAVTALALPNLAAGATAIFRFVLDGVTTGAVR